MGNICVFETPRNVPPEQWDMKPIMVSPIASRETATRVTWGPFNDYLIVAYGNGSLVQMDPVSGAVLLEKQVGVPMSMMISPYSIVIVVAQRAGCGGQSVSEHCFCFCSFRNSNSAQ